MPLRTEPRDEVLEGWQAYCVICLCSLSIHTKKVKQMRSHLVRGSLNSSQGAFLPTLPKERGYVSRPHQEGSLPEAQRQFSLWLL